MIREEGKKVEIRRFEDEKMGKENPLDKIAIGMAEKIDSFIFEVINPWCEQRMQCKISKDDLEKALKQYFAEPSIRPKGEWIKGDKSLQCPKCGAKGENIESDFVFNYCPCCGARLGDPNEED